MLIPDGFQCLVVVQRNPLGEFGCIRSLWGVPSEFGCTPCLLNREVSTRLHRVTRLSPRTGVYVLCTLLFGCIECSGCIRVQSIFFADGPAFTFCWCGTLYWLTDRHDFKGCCGYLPQERMETSQTPLWNYIWYGCEVFWRVLGITMQIPRNKKENAKRLITLKKTDKRKEPTKCWKVTSTTSSTMTKTIGINCYHYLSPPIKIPRQAHTSYPPSSATTALTLRQNGWKKETYKIQEEPCILTGRKQCKKKQERPSSRYKKWWKEYSDQGATPQPDIEIGDLVILNTKNVKTKRPTKILSPRLYGPFKVIETRGNRAFKLDLQPRWKIQPIFHVSLLELYKVSDWPNREQPAREPEDVEGDMESEVENIVKSEVITYTRKVRRKNKEFKRLRYVVKWAGCSVDDNTLEPPEGLLNAR